MTMIEKVGGPTFRARLLLAGNQISVHVRTLLMEGSLAFSIRRPSVEIQ